jgi:hypothetical protein
VKEEDPLADIKMNKTQTSTVSKSEADLHNHTSSDNFTNDKKMSVDIKQEVLFKPEIQLHEVIGNIQ